MRVAHLCRAMHIQAAVARAARDAATQQIYQRTSVSPEARTAPESKHSRWQAKIYREHALPRQRLTATSRRPLLDVVEGVGRQSCRSHSRPGASKAGVRPGLADK